MIDPKARKIAACSQPSILQVPRDVWLADAGEDVVEYAVVLAVILVVVIGTIHLIGGNANNAFSSVASNLQ
jgi:Flp pilus assembly pilin Flp